MDKNTTELFLHPLYAHLGEHGWHSGESDESARLPPMWLGLDSSSMPCVGYVFVVGSPNSNSTGTKDLHELTPAEV